VNERLQKILARAGYGSRRSAEALITSGRVTVNGRRVTELGTQADPLQDAIAVDERLVQLTARTVYIAVHKPAGYVTTARDPQHRATVMKLLPPELPPHVLPVGRLDQATEGLLIFTNDGEFAHRLSHPRYEVEKEYHALVTGIPTAAAFSSLRGGIDIDGHRTSAAAIERAAPPDGHAEGLGHMWVRVVIHEGRKRQVRLMFAAVGHQVRDLVRTRVGPVVLGDLPSGAARPLRSSEIQALRRKLRLPSS
jgi:23S rRNA pseudouridine2605 synthase